MTATSGECACAGTGVKDNLYATAFQVNKYPTCEPTPLAVARRSKLEDQLDRKTAELISLRKLAMGGGSGEYDTAAGTMPGPEAPGSSARGPQQVPHAWAGDGEGSDGDGGSSPAPSSASRQWQQQQQQHVGGRDVGSTDTAALAAQMEAMRLQHSREAAALAEGEARWRQMAEALQVQLDEARAAALAGGSGANAGAAAMDDEAAAALEAAEDRCETLGRERDALRTILDSKVQHEHGPGVALGDIVCCCRSHAALYGTCTPHFEFVQP